MASRGELELRAAKANVTSSSYPNDSKFEQAIIFAEKASTASAVATTQAAPVKAQAEVSGGKNV